MLSIAPGEASKDFFKRADAWFTEKRHILEASSDTARAHLLDGSHRIGFDGLSASDPIAPNVLSHSVFIDGENQNNIRLRALASGLWDMVLSLEAEGVLRPNVYAGEGYMSDATLQLFRDLEFYRIRELSVRNSIDEVRKRYYNSEGGGKQAVRFIRRRVVPLVEAGLLRCQSKSRGYDILSGPVLTSFTDNAFVPFLEYRARASGAV